MQPAYIYICAPVKKAKPFTRQLKTLDKRISD